MPLTRRQRKCWSDYGYLVVEGFFDEREIATIEESLERTWQRRPNDVIVDDVATGRRLRASQIADDELVREFRVSDLYLSDPNVRSVVSSARVASLIGELLADQPVVCNTLNFDRGSQQDDHLDTLFMTPHSDYQLVATWMALEDTSGDAGPLRYWPGSQRIEPFRFSTGLLHVVPDEMNHWTEYMNDALDRHGVSHEHFLARRGDLFIWDALLLHGGSQICDPGLTRKSLVTHFWSKTDCDTNQLATRAVENGAGLWLDRLPQAIPAEATASDERLVDPWAKRVSGL